MKENNKELLIKFDEKSDIKEVDDLINLFQNKIDEIDKEYYLKESESPFIYFLEYDNPNELIKKFKDDEFHNYFEIIPVTCVTSNSNYVISTILKKIRHKLTYNDTFNLTCHIDNAYESQEEHMKVDLTNQIKNIIKIPENNSNPNWDINLYIIGEITGINIKRNYINM